MLASRGGLEYPYLRTFAKLQSSELTAAIPRLTRIPLSRALFRPLSEFHLLQAIRLLPLVSFEHVKRAFKIIFSQEKRTLFLIVMLFQSNSSSDPPCQAEGKFHLTLSPPAALLPSPPSHILHSSHPTPSNTTPPTGSLLPPNLSLPQHLQPLPMRLPRP